MPATDTLRHLLRKNIIVNGGALCIRTEAARRVGGYDASLRFAEDPRRARRFRSDQWRCRPDIFAAPALRERFTERERRRYRHLAEINTHWLGAATRSPRGASAASRSIWSRVPPRYRDSALQWRLIYVFFRNLPLSRQRG